MKQLQRIVAWWGGMTPRERAIVAVGGGVLLLIVLYVGVVEPLAESRRSLERKVAARQRELAEVRTEADRVVALRGRLAAFDARLAAGADVSPLSELEGLTAGMGMAENVSSMSPGQKGSVDGYEEQLVTLHLKKVTLGKVTGLLKELATSKNGFTVKRLEIKPEFEDPSLLTVSLTVAAYEPL